MGDKGRRGFGLDRDHRKARQVGRRELARSSKGGCLWGVKWPTKEA
jgi:hypothetical protein